MFRDVDHEQRRRGNPKRKKYPGIYSPQTSLEDRGVDSKTTDLVAVDLWTFNCEHHFLKDKEALLRTMECYCQTIREDQLTRFGDPMMC